MPKPGTFTDSYRGYTMTTTLERSICAPLPRYIVAMEAALDHWQGAPEELGECLELASSRVGGWASPDSRAQARIDRFNARRRIMELPNGASLLLALAAH